MKPRNVNTYREHFKDTNAGYELFGDNPLKYEHLIMITFVHVPRCLYMKSIIVFWSNMIVRNDDIKLLIALQWKSLFTYFILFILGCTISMKYENIFKMYLNIAPKSTNLDKVHVCDLDHVQSLLKYLYCSPC